MADDGSDRRSKRARRASEVATKAGSSSEHATASPSARPTPTELQEALDVIRSMQAPCHDHPILARRAPAKLNVVACAVAMYRGETFESDAQALQLFGVKPRTDVRGTWVSKLALLAPNGLGNFSETAVPVYLLDRDEEQQQDSEQQLLQPSESSSEHDSDESEDDDRQAARRQERREQRFFRREYDRERVEHERQQREAPARRAREAAEWDAAHGAERDEIWTKSGRSTRCVLGA